jgi:ankyrin repeat protein
MDNRFLIVEAAEKAEGTALVKDLIAAGADVHAQDPSSKRTALIAASSCGEIETVEVLLKSGAKADAKDSHGKTALMVSSGNGKIVKLLVEAGADLDLVDGEGQGALSIAARFENKDFLVALNEAGVSLTSHPVLLELAASQEDTDPSFTKVDFLCKLGFDPNKQDSNGDTPLMWAIYGNRLENVRALIRCGADVSIKNSQGKSALDLAQYYKDIEIYQALKQERKSALTFAAQAKKQNKESTASP